MSKKSEKSESNESSFSDWCFLSSQTSSSTASDIQSLSKEFIPESLETADTKDEANESLKDGFPTVQDAESNEILKLGNFNNSSCLESRELSEGNSDSSSDVEILEEPPNLTLSYSSDKNVDAGASFLGGSFSLSTLDSSDSAPVEENITKYTVSPKISSPSKIDKKIQTSHFENHHLDFNINRLADFGNWLNHRYEGNLRSIYIYVFGAHAIILLSVFLLTNLNSDATQLEASLHQIQNSIVQCFGEQHLEGLRRGDERLLSSPMCVHNAKKYSNAIQRFLDPEVKKLLITGLYDSEDPFYVSFEDSHDELLLDVIISQLQFLKLLPDTESEVTIHSSRPKEKMSSESMEKIDQEKSAEKTEPFKTDDLVIAKNAAYQPSLNEHYKNKDLDSYNKLLRDLDAFGAFLHMEKLKLQKKMEEDQHTCASQASCSSANKVGEREKTTTQESLLGEDKQKRTSLEQDNTAEKIKPYLDDLASVLSSEILNLHNSLVNELKEVKKWNELLQNITMQARNTSHQSETGNWSWLEIRENIENMVLEAHQDFKEKISAFQMQNITETVQNIVEDNKKNAEYLLNMVNHYYNAVKEKTQSILETPMPEIEVDSTVKGFWSIVNNLQDKWHYVKKEVKQMAKKFRKQRNGYQESKDAFGPETASENWYFKRSSKRVNDYDRPHSKSDWLFKRAAQRAKHHRKITKDKTFA